MNCPESFLKSLYQPYKMIIISTSLYFTLDKNSEFRFIACGGSVFTMVIFIANDSRIRNDFKKCL